MDSEQYGASSGMHFETDQVSNMAKNFLPSSGEMSRLTAEYPWEQTSLGSLNAWPSSLRTLVNMMLNSRFPMLIFWGPDLITFYNDAFRPSLGNDGKHPSSLGQKGEQSWAESWPTIGPMIHNIMEGGDAVWFEDQKLPIYREGKMGYAYWTYSFSPLANDEGATSGVLVTCVESTEKVESIERLEQARASIQESQKALLNLFEQSPVAIAVIAKEKLTFRMANPFYATLVGRTVADVVDKPLLEALPEIEGQGFDKLLEEVIATGVPFISNEVSVDLKRGEGVETFYVDLAYQPMKGDDGEITGIFVIATDVTQQVVTRKQIEASEARFQNLLRDATVGLVLLEGEDSRVAMANEAYGRLIGFPVDQILQKPIFEVIPDAEASFRPLIEKVYKTGEPEYLNGAPYMVHGENGDKIEGFINLVYQPFREPNGNISGVMVVVNDVTELARTSIRLAASETKFRSLIAEAPYATALYTGRDLVIELANVPMIKLWGKTPEVLGMKLADALPELEGQPFIPLLHEVFDTGKPYQTMEQSADLVVDGKLQTYWFNFTYKPLFDELGKVYAVLNMAVDITEQVMQRRKLEAAEERLSEAIELAQLATWDIDLPGEQIIMSNRLQNWLGLDSNIVPTGGPSYIHARDEARVSNAFAGAMVPDGSGKIDESYTIVNQKTGIHRIIHIVGTTVFDNAGTPVQITGTAQDITIQKELQMALESDVQLRTEELGAAVEELRATNEELSQANEQLTRSNEELAQYAYVASHDLQEPLRKIRLFSSRLHMRTDLPEEVQWTIGKIETSTERMSLLIQDLLEFSRLLNSDNQFAPVDLKGVVEALADDFELIIQDKHAEIQVGDLPLLSAVGLQMNQLFYNLIGNALKFSVPERRPVIKVDASIAGADECRRFFDGPVPSQGFWHITVEDNGIGFQQEYAEQIFDVFKRLHGRDEFSGSGIGLALCRRIVHNHDGHMYAEGRPGQGAIFHIFLPADKM